MRLVGHGGMTGKCSLARLLAVQLAERVPSHLRPTGPCLGIARPRGDPNRSAQTLGIGPQGKGGPCVLAGDGMKGLKLNLGHASRFQGESQGALEIFLTGQFGLSRT